MVSNTSTISGVGINTSCSITGWFYARSEGGVLINYKNDSNDRISTTYNNGEINSAVYDGSWKGEQSAPASVKNWHHFAAVWDGNSKMQLYLDGEKAGSSGASASTRREAGTYIGRKQNGEMPFDGLICDARIYDRRLTPEEVRELYEWGSGDFARPLNDSNSSSAVSRWDFDGDAKDLWGNNDGSRNGPNFSLNGVRKQSLNFNGSGDTMNASLGSFSEFTTSLWLNIEDDSNDSYLLWGDKNDGSSNSYEAPMIRINNGSLKFFGREDLNHSDYYTQQWAHIVYVASSEKDYYFFNGEIVETASSSGTVNWNDLNFGNRPGDSSYYDGKIDDFRIYDKALSPSEVFELYRWGTRGRDLRKQLVNQR